MSRDGARFSIPKSTFFFSCAFRIVDRTRASRPHLLTPSYRVNPTVNSFDYHHHVHYFPGRSSMLQTARPPIRFSSSFRYISANNKPEVAVHRGSCCPCQPQDHADCRSDQPIELVRNRRPCCQSEGKPIQHPQSAPTCRDPLPRLPTLAQRNFGFRK